MYNICKDQVIKDQIFNIAELVQKMEISLDTFGMLTKSDHYLTHHFVSFNINELADKAKAMERALRAIIMQYAEQTQGAPQDAEMLRLMCGSGEAISDGRK